EVIDREFDSRRVELLEDGANTADCLMVRIPDAGQLDQRNGEVLEVVDGVGPGITPLLAKPLVALTVILAKPVVESVPPPQKRVRTEQGSAGFAARTESPLGRVRRVRSWPGRRRSRRCP